MRHYLATLGTLAAVLAMPAAAQETISKTQVRSDPPQETHERLRDVFWDLFPVHDLRSEETPTMPLQGLYLDTRPRPTAFGKLCQRDRLVIVFEQAGDDAGPDVQQAAESFVVSSFFSFTEMPRRFEMREVHDQPRELCTSLPDDQPYFHADNISMAFFSHLALGRLQDAIAEGSFEAAECDTSPDRAACAQRIATIALADVQDVSRCAAEGDEVCYQIALRPDGVKGQHLLIFADGRISGLDVAVLRAELRESILLFHPRPD